MSKVDQTETSISKSTGTTLNPDSRETSKNAAIAQPKVTDMMLIRLCTTATTTFQETGNQQFKGRIAQSVVSVVVIIKSTVNGLVLWTLRESMHSTAKPK